MILAANYRLMIILNLGHNMSIFYPPTSRLLAGEQSFLFIQQPMVCTNHWLTYTFEKPFCYSPYKTHCPFLPVPNHSKSIANYLPLATVQVLL